MKIAVATEEGGLDDDVSPILGRCTSFTIVEASDGTINGAKVISNPGSLAQGGAGILASNLIADEGADFAVAGNFGPKAARVLSASNVKMVRSGAKARDAVEDILAGDPDIVEGATVGEHHGMGGRHGHGRGKR